MNKAIVLFLALAAVSAAGAQPTDIGINLAQVIVKGPGGWFYGQPLAAGDLDGDGIDELIIGRSDDGDEIDDGVYIFKGREDFLEMGLVDLTLASPDLVVTGTDPDDALGSSVAVGNINGDAYNDLILAAPRATANGREAAGVVYVIFGGPDLLSEGAIDLNTHGSWDLRIYGAEAGDDTGGSGSFFGGGDAEALAVGNLNGDDYGDLIIGVHWGNPTGSAGPYGRVYVIFGEDFTAGSTYDLLSVGAMGYDIRIIGHGDGDETGLVVLAGDLDGDTYDELIIPCYYYSGLGFFSTEGRVHIFKGRATWPSQFDLRSINADITITGTTNYDQVGETATLGDFNGDGTVDLAIGASGDELGSDPNPNNQDGLIHVYFGGALFDVSSASYNLDSQPGDLVVVGHGYDTGGYPIRAGDIDGDGKDDLVIAHRDISLGGTFSEGVTEIILGRESYPTSPLELTRGEADYRLLGARLDQAGSWVVTGDFDGVSPEEVGVSSSFNNSIRGTVWVMNVLDSAEPVPVGVAVRGR